MLALLAAFLFGASTVALRWPLARGADAEGGTLVTVATGFAVVAGFAVAHSATLDARGVAVFAVAGLLAPAGSQLLFTLAIRDGGASRASVVAGAAVLREPFSAGLAVGALLVVAGGTVLVLERNRPEHLLAIGLVFSAAGAMLFAVRDNYVRAMSDGVALEASAAAAVALLTGLLALLVYVGVRRPASLLALPRSSSFVPAGLLYGLSYVALFEAYYRGRVSVVSPLVATEALWGVVLSALLLRQSELVGARLVLGACIVVAGGALIGAFR